MPVMDGVTATRLLREGGIVLPVVGVTGNALEEDIHSFMMGGATEIVVGFRAASCRCCRCWFSVIRSDHARLLLCPLRLICALLQTKPVSALKLERVLQQYTHFRSPPPTTPTFNASRTSTPAPPRSPTPTPSPAPPSAIHSAPASARSPS